MIIIAVACILYVGFHFIMRHKKVHTSPAKNEPEWAVDNLSGPGWSLVGVDVRGPLVALEVDDPGIDLELDFAPCITQYDVN